MIKSDFYIKVLKNGKQYPIFNILPKKYEMLYELGMYKYSTYQGVEEAITSITDVLNDTIKEYELSTGDWCVVKVKKKISKISNNFEAFEPIEIPTEDLLNLMKEWQEFLKAYENNKIPCLKYCYP